MSALICAAVQAEPDVLGPPRLEIEALQQWESARRGSAAGWRPIDAAALSSTRWLPGVFMRPAFTDDGLRARWWWGRGAIEVGAGADWLAPSGTALVARPWSPVLGVRASLSAQTRIVYESGPASAWRDAETGGVTPRTTRVALEFKSKSPVGDLRTSLTRVQLTGDSALHFKPRGGGLQVSYRERF